ncbi:MAG: UDP-N-acetylmuramoyl-L-alanyl-D-glutamate--2,6-diaminopimelate ligase, partial [Aliifodinibius sp.]|nr:UDP-N-acetylmuramoyl-L-alanyl-D-glutamate--2,6-diaminopimelate ligase [candidate division Zixibacteria bacterium]NIT56433.1 UDP-N-acetylmuramoyl-L-alanyl-D-glutamate--2,6-diaminopimelate ligase [Fodinibius sp.]NIV11399.1 UDP-N-acetylmuramoyl-L-alanyl-D-glutamate--2,6-diaminopimelate ligase [Fodinibius sp.]NIY25016.1 UDP-N-acetylmuramoyl-L-alanyl-D-glutamate--2,6-diaminopimelate ligase [Fodinibius sp.]
NDAVNRGAAAIVSDQPGTAGNTPYLHIADIAVYLVDILERFYAIQEAPVKLYGITGTNGKTSCA